MKIVFSIRCQVSKRKSSKNTYGWARAEVFGALVNSVFLVALCFTIFVEAIERLTHTHMIEQVDILLYVGIIGLVVNVLGLFLFHPSGHGHSHGGHGHSHGVDGHQVEETSEQQTEGRSDGTLIMVTVLQASVSTVGSPAGKPRHKTPRFVKRKCIKIMN